MWEEYAQKIWVKTNALTLDQKREAEYQWVLAESKFQVGDATKYAEWYAGAVARQDAASLKLQQTIGTALMPAMTKLTETVTAILTPIADWISKHPELSANIILVTLWVAGLTTWLVALGMILWPITAAIAAIWTVAGIVLSPVLLVTWAIIGLGTALYTVWKNWDAIRPTLLLVWEQIKKDVSAVVDSITNYIIGGFNTAVKKVEEAVNYLSRLAQKAKDFVWQVMSSAWTSYMNSFLSKPGEALGNLVYGARASWWPVGWWKPYLVGEKWPEIFTPGVSWNIIPNNKIGWGSSIIINISWVFGSDAVGEISDAIVTNLKRASYV